MGYGTLERFQSGRKRSKRSAPARFSSIFSNESISEAWSGEELETKRYPLFPREGWLEAGKWASRHNIGNVSSTLVLRATELEGPSPIALSILSCSFSPFPIMKALIVTPAAASNWFPVSPATFPDRAPTSSQTIKNRFSKRPEASSSRASKCSAVLACLNHTALTVCW